MEIGSIKSGLQSGLKHAAIIATMKRQTGSGHGSLIIGFIISWVVFLLPCINTKTQNPEILKVTVKKGTNCTNPNVRIRCKNGQGIAVADSSLMK